MDRELKIRKLNAFIVIFGILLFSLFALSGNFTASFNQQSPKIKKIRPYVEKLNELLINSLKELMHEMIEKIECDVDITAKSFADAHNIQRNLRWAAIFGTTLDVTVATIDSISSLLTLTDFSRGLTEEFLNYELPLQAFSGLMTVDSLIQSGEKLQLAIDGPSYYSNIKTMLDEAYKESSTHLFFNYEAYKNTIKHHLLGLYGSTSILIPHKSSNINRKNIEIVRGVNKVEKSIKNKFRNLIKELSENPLSADLIEEMINQIEKIRKNILRSKLHMAEINYKTYLKDGANYVSVRPEIWLGNIGELEKIRIDALTNFDKKLEREEIMTINKALGAIVKATKIYLNIKYPSSKFGKSLGQVSNVFILPPAIDLSDRVMSTKVYKTNPREQVNMLPQEMLLTLQKELSDLWMIADDIANYVEYYIQTQ